MRIPINKKPKPIKRNSYNVLDGAFGFSFAVLAVMIVTLTIGFINLSNVNMWYNLVAMAVFQLCFVVIWINYSRNKGVCRACATKLNKPTSMGALFAVLVSLACFAVGIGIEAVLIWFFGLINYPLTEIEVTTGQLVLFAIVTVCLAPIGEELIFRGIVLRSLEKKSKVLAILLSGALFAIFHMSPEQTVYQFGLGCALAFVAIKTNSIYTAIIGHFVSNGLAVLRTLLPIDSLTYGFVALGVIGVVGTTIILLKCNSLLSDNGCNCSKNADGLVADINTDIVKDIAEDINIDIVKDKDEASQGVNAKGFEELQANSNSGKGGRRFNPVTHLIVVVYFVGIGVCLLTWITNLIYGLTQG